MTKNNDEPFIGNEKDEWREREIGALWLKENKEKNKKFYTGKVKIEGKEVEIIVFRNNRKFDKDFKPDADKSKYPDLVIYTDKKKDS